MPALSIGGGLLFETDGPALVLRVSNFNRTRIAQCFVEQEVGDFFGACIRLRNRLP